MVVAVYVSCTGEWLCVVLRNVSSVGARVHSQRQQSKEITSCCLLWEVVCCSSVALAGVSVILNVLATLYSASISSQSIVDSNSAFSGSGKLLSLSDAVFA